MRLFLALNGLDFVDTTFAMKYYVQPTVFSRPLTAASTAHCEYRYDERCAAALHPTGGVSGGGTSVTLFGEGFDAFRLDPSIPSCRWGDAVTTPTAIEAGRIVCPAPSAADATASSPGTTSVPLRLSLNGVHFAETGATFSYFVQPANFSSISPTGGALSSLTAVTIAGEGFLAFSNSSAKLRCRWGLDTNYTLPAGAGAIDAPLDAALAAVLGLNATEAAAAFDAAHPHETVALELSDERVVCPAHPKVSAGARELSLSLNSVDFGSSGLHYKYYEQLQSIAMLPTGGLAGDGHGGTPVTFAGDGFDAFFGRLDDTLCRWGNETFTSPESLSAGQLVCRSAPLPAGDVPVSIALNRVDFAALGLAYRYYAAPSFSSIGPALGASNGGVRVTVKGSGFARFSGLAASARCRWGAGRFTTTPVTLADDELVCLSARRADLQANATYEGGLTTITLDVALNAVDYTSTGAHFDYFSESIANVTVATGPAGGPTTGGTLVTVTGVGLAGVQSCKFGNGTASPVHAPCTFDVCVCVSTSLGDGTEPDGAQFGQGPRYLDDAQLAASAHARGFVPMLLSRELEDSADAFFHVAASFYYFPAPANFSSIYPGGGPHKSGADYAWQPTMVTITGEGFLGFDGDAAQVRVPSL